MKTQNIERCPTCGNVINEREVPLSAQMVRALWNVYRHCLATGKHEFTRKQIDPFIAKGTEYANFGYWKWWSAGMVYTPTIEGKTGRGYWGFNIERLEEFFDGKYMVYTRIWTKGKGKHREIKAEDPKFLREIPDITAFMEDDEYVARYRAGQKSLL